LVVRETVVAEVGFAETEVAVCANDSVAAAKTKTARAMFFTGLLDLGDENWFIFLMIVDVGRNAKNRKG